MSQRRWSPTDPKPALTDRRNPLSAWLEPRTLLIGLLVLAAAFTEGSALDWLSVGIVDGYGTPSWVGVLGFAAFVSAMTVGRVLGTSWLDRYGRVPVLWTAFALAAVGALLVIFGPFLGLVAAFAGALIWGLGPRSASRWAERGGRRPPACRGPGQRGRLDRLPGVPGRSAAARFPRRPPRGAARAARGGRADHPGAAVVPATRPLPEGPE